MDSYVVSFKLDYFFNQLLLSLQRFKNLVLKRVGEISSVKPEIDYHSFVNFIKIM